MLTDELGMIRNHLDARQDLCLIPDLHYGVKTDAMNSDKGCRWSDAYGSGTRREVAVVAH